LQLVRPLARETFAVLGLLSSVLMRLAVARHCARRRTSSISSKLCVVVRGTGSNYVFRRAMFVAVTVEVAAAPYLGSNHVTLITDDLLSSRARLVFKDVM